MNTYLFNFDICPIDKTWWTSYRNESFKTSADSIKEAEENFFNYLSNNLGFEVSKTAKKRFSKMYRDTKEGSCKQVGKVFKASTEIDFDRVWKRNLLKYGPK